MEFSHYNECGVISYVFSKEKKKEKHAQMSGWTSTLEEDADGEVSRKCWSQSLTRCGVMTLGWQQLGLLYKIIKIYITL